MGGLVGSAFATSGGSVLISLTCPTGFGISPDADPDLFLGESSSPFIGSVDTGVLGVSGVENPGGGCPVKAPGGGGGIVLGIGPFTMKGSCGTNANTHCQAAILKIETSLTTN